MNTINKIFPHANPPKKADHSKLSPSAGKMWFTCAGSINLPQTFEIPLPEEDVNPYAAEGTAAHWVGETALRLRTRPSQIPVEKFFNMEVPEGIEISYINTEMLQHLDAYFDFIEIEGGFEKDSHLFLETFFTHWDKDLSDGILGGTIDALHTNADDKILRVTDLKYGRIPVPPHANIQLMIYALLALGPDNPGNFENVKLSIVQPRALYDDIVFPVKSTVYEVGALYRWHGSILLPRINEILNGAMDLKPDPSQNSHCKWCRAKALCPAYKSMVLEKIYKYMGDPAALSPKELKDALSVADAAIAWGYKLKDFAKLSIMQGHEFKGWTVRKSKGREKFKEPHTALSELIMLADPLKICNLKTPGQVRSELGEVVDIYAERGPDTYSLIASKGTKKSIVPNQGTDIFGKPDEEDKKAVDKFTKTS